ncbi:MAG: hypothetical protein CMH82_00315 [Nocardioides sp.]|nr:hypothetical protein [Nocardioides sp.]
MTARNKSAIHQYLLTIGDALATGASSEAVAAMREMIESSSLRSEIADIVAAEQRVEVVATSGQVHPNSFVKYVVAQADGVKLVLHVWTQPDDVDKVETHNHRWNFVSTVLAGSLNASTLDVGAAGLPVTEYEYSSPSGEDRFELRVLGPRELELVEAVEISAGTTYFQPFREIHQAHVTEKPTVTLIVQGPVLQATTRVFIREGRTDAQSDIARSVVRPSLDQTRADLMRLSDLLSKGKR